MRIIKIVTTGSKDTEKLYEQIKINELVQSPFELFEKYYLENDYYEFMTRIGIENLEFSKERVSEKQSLLNKLINDTKKIIEIAKTNPNFDPNLSTIQPSRFGQTLGKLERHTFSLESLDAADFEEVAKKYKSEMKTNSPFAFLNIDSSNKLIHLTESIKTITSYKEDVLFDRRPKRFFSSQGSRAADRITNGLNHTSDYKHFNFNLNLEAQSLFKTIHNVLKTNEKDLCIGFKFGSDEQKIYYKSNLFNSVPSEFETQGIEIEQQIKIEKVTMHKERQGSLSPQEIDKSVKQRESKIKLEPSIVAFKEAMHIEEDTKEESIVEIVEQVKEEPFGQIKSKKSPLEIYRDSIKSNRERKQNAIQNMLLEKIQNTFDNKEKYIGEFYDLLNKGNGIHTAIERIKERYLNEPFIFDLITSEIKIEIESIKEKEEIINILDSEHVKLEEIAREKEKEIKQKDERISVLSTEYESLELKFENTVDNFNVEIDNLESGIKERDEKFKIVINTKELELQKVLERGIKQNERISELNENYEKLSKSMQENLKKNAIELDKMEQKLEEKDERISELNENYEKLSKSMQENLKENAIELDKKEERITILEEKNISYISKFTLNFEKWENQKDTLSKSIEVLNKEIAELKTHIEKEETDADNWKQ